MFDRRTPLVITPACDINVVRLGVVCEGVREEAVGNFLLDIAEIDESQETVGEYELPASAEHEGQYCNRNNNQKLAHGKAGEHRDRGFLTTLNRLFFNLELTITHKQ